MVRKISAAVALVLFVSALLTQISSDGHSGYSAAIASPQSAGDGPRVVEDSMHEFMEYVFQPTYRRLREAMKEEPADNGGWKTIKSDALILAESCNLLFARTPKEDGDAWNAHAAQSRDHGAALYKAARSRDFGMAVTSYRAMLESCNACHRQFEDGRHILNP